MTAEVGLVGRDRELDELRLAYAAATRGQGRLVMLSGEAGIGKTSLAESLSRQVRSMEGSVVWGRCWESGGGPAYAPWTQAVRAVLSTLPRGEARRLAGPAVALVPELGEPLEARQAAESEEARFALFDSVTGLLRRAGEKRSLLLVLDDLHAADLSSLLMLRFVARELGDARVLVVGTYRDVEARLEPQVARLITDVNREGNRMFLQRLGRDDMKALVSQRTGIRGSQPLVESLHEATGGNPFFACELIGLLEAEGRLELGVDDAELPVPQGVREMVKRRLERADEETREVLLAGAVVGRELTLPLIEAVCAQPALRLLDPLDRAVELGILREAAEGGRGWRFSHALVRDTLYLELDDLRRADLHGRVGAALEHTLDDHEPHLAELAHHFLEAGDVGKAAAYTAGAGDRASRLLAYENAVEHYRRALTLAAPLDPERRCDLLLALGDAEWRAGEAAAARETFLAAGDEALALRSPERAARAALGYGGRFGWMEATAEVDRPLVKLLEDALAAQPPGDSAVKAQLMARLSIHLYLSTPDIPRREQLIREALEMARRVGDRAALAHALNARRYLLWHSTGIDERLTTSTELVEVAEQAGEDELMLRGHSWLIIDLLERCDLPGAEAAAERHELLAERLRQPLFRTEALKWRALRALLEGRLEEAERRISEFAAAAQGLPDLLPAQSAATQLYTLRFMQGRIGELEAGVRAFADRVPLAPWRCALATLYAETGRLDEARAEVARIDASGFLDETPVGSWAVAAGTLTEACRLLGDTARAERLYRLLLPYEGLGLVIGYAAAWNGAADRTLGVLATMLGRHDDAERHLRRALELNERMGAAFWLTWTWIDLAWMLRARDGPGDREQAAGLLERAARRAAEMGFRPLAERAAGVPA